MGGGFLTIGYCFPIVFWKFLWKGQGLDGVGQRRNGGSCLVPPAREYPEAGVETVFASQHESFVAIQYHIMKRSTIILYAAQHEV